MGEIRVRNGDVELFAVVEGTGPALVMMHGGTNHHRSVLPLLHPAITDAFTLIAPDIRGHGASVCRDPDLHGWDHYASDVIAILDHLGIERAAVGGASLGSGVAIAAAMRHPDRVASLVLTMNAFYGNDPGPPVSQQQALEPVRAFIDRVLEIGVERAVAEASEGLTPHQIEHGPGWILIHDAPSVIACLQAIRTQPFDGIDDLRNLRMPALVIPGFDALHPQEVSEMYAEALPNATMSAHRIWDFAPDFKGYGPAFVGDIRAFLERTMTPAA